MNSRSPAAIAAGELPLIGGRYAVRRRLGRGGMALVYEADDLVAQRACALKRLEFKADADKRRNGTQLFAREFQQLAQLRHPHIVQVYEYAIDADGPYYTMELVDGADLQHLVPLPWRSACTIARDVCSALSLLHSRSLLHRDVSPRNVRCDAGDFAKLLDFGAMTGFGPSQLIMGTPACSAPEIVAQQQLDARTDLYALGATLYFMLTGWHAYPARTFSELAELWREPIVPPSKRAAEIPPALESLVLNLLRFDPDARPASAAEVMQRLSAIDGYDLDESALVAQAYLSTPTLVGRTRALARARECLKRAALGQGASIAIEGPSGVGRSRFLDACVLDAMLLGLTVVRIGADQAHSGYGGLARSIAAQLLERAPGPLLDAAQPALDMLGHARPELAAQLPELISKAIESEQARGLWQQALRQWLLGVCAHTPLVIAVDDMQRVDDESATLLALLACELSERPLLLIATLDSETEAYSSPACKLLLEHSHRQPLRALEAGDAEQLLRSLFGDAPNVDVLAHRLWQLSDGNPRQIMQLAQHMLDSGLVRYHGGAWSLPSAVGATALAVTASEAQRARIAGLSPHARELASGLALCPDLSFCADEAAKLCGLAADSGSDPGIDELLRAGIVRCVRDQVALSRPTWGEQLTADLGPDSLRVMHQRIAEALAARGDQPFRVAQHTLLAGRLDEGLQLLVAHAHASQEETTNGEHVFLRYVRSLPRDWLQVFHRGVQLCAELERPARQRYALLGRLVGIEAMLALDDKPTVSALLGELVRASGLDDWAALDANMPPQLRLQRALEQAQARYDGLPERERVLDPLRAIHHLARAMVAASGIAASAMDVEAVRQMPSLEPLVPLSPALGVVQALLTGMIARYTGRFERAAECYRNILERASQPDRAGLDAAHSGFLCMGVINGLGMIEAGLGKVSSLEWAAQLDLEPTHRVNALQIRMLYELWRGNGLEASYYKHSVDRVRIENSARHWFEGSHLLWEVDAYSLCDDVMNLKRAREELAPLAARNPAWQVVDSYAAAHLHYTCGDLPRALSEVERALQTLAAGEHQSWTRIVALQLRILLDVERSGEALLLGGRYLADAEAAQLGYRCEYVRMALALTHAKLGRRASAIELADRAIAALHAADIAGLNLGSAYETRARVALSLRDAYGFKHFTELTGEIYGAHRYPPLVAKLESLVRDGKQQLAGISAVTTRPDARGPTAERMGSAFGARATPETRAGLLLGLLVEHSRAASGHLFGVEGRRLIRLASSGGAEPPAPLLEFVGGYLARELDDQLDTTREADVAAPSPATWTSPDGRTYRAVMLSHYDADHLVVSGVAVLDASADVFIYPAQLAKELSKYTDAQRWITVATQ